MPLQKLVSAFIPEQRAAVTSVWRHCLKTDLYMIPIKPAITITKRDTAAAVTPAERTSRAVQVITDAVSYNLS